VNQHTSASLRVRAASSSNRRSFVTSQTTGRRSMILSSVANTRLDGTRGVSRIEVYASIWLSGSFPNSHLLSFRSAWNHFSLSTCVPASSIMVVGFLHMGLYAQRAHCRTAGFLLGTSFADRLRTEFMAKVSRRSIPPRDPDPSCRGYTQPPHFFHLA